MIGAAIRVARIVCRELSKLMEYLLPKKRAKVIAALTVVTTCYLAAVILLIPVTLLIAQVIYVAMSVSVLLFIWTMYLQSEEYVLS